MEEIQIAIECLQDEMNILTNKVYSFSKNGRYPDESDWLEIAKLLNYWSNKRERMLELNDCLNAINNNSKKNTM